MQHERYATRPTTLDRACGALLSAAGFRRLASVVGQVEPSASLRSWYGEVVRSLTPRLHREPHLIDMAWRCLEGAADEGRRLRQLVEAAGADEPWSDDPKDASRPSATFLPLERSVPLVLALLTTVRGLKDGSELLDALERSTSGAGELEAILQGGLRAMAHADRLHLRRVVTRVAEELPEPPPLPRSEDPLGMAEDLGEAHDASSPLEPTTQPATLDENVQRILDLLASAGTYEITDVTPQPVCAGSTITITGTGFDPEVTSVTFAAQDGGIVSAKPATQQAGSVDVVVPDEAVSGPLSLTIYGTSSVWQIANASSVPDLVADDSPPPLNAGSTLPTIASLDLPKHGTIWPFEVGSAGVASFSVNGQTGDVCVRPGDTLAIAWSVWPATARVEVTYDGNIIYSQAGVPLGSTTVPAGAGEGSAALVIEVKPGGSCADASQTIQVYREHTRPQLTIEGVEITQGVQSLWRTDEPDNSVPLVGEKRTIVRVFVSSDRGGANNDEAEVDGVIEIPNLPPLPSRNGPITVGRLDKTRRSDRDYSLNFVIEPGDAKNVLALDITAFSNSRCPGVARSEAEATRSATFFPVPPLTIRVVRIRDSTGAPSPGEAEQLIIDASRYIPAPIDIDVLPGVFDLTTHPEWYYYDSTGTESYKDGMGRDWLLELIRRKREWEEPSLFSSAVWVGVTPQFTFGKATGPPAKVCIAPLGTEGDIRTKAAHEIAHCLGLGHVVTSEDGDEECSDFLGAFQPAAGCERLDDGGLVHDPMRPFTSDGLFDPILEDVVADPAGQVWALMGYRSAHFRWTHREHWKRMLSWLL